MQPIHTQDPTSEYLARRAAQEQAMADASNDPAARDIHRKLAEHFAGRAATARQAA